MGVRPDVDVEAPISQTERMASTQSTRGLVRELALDAVGDEAA